MKLLHLALAAVASANSAAPTEADWLAAVRAAEPEVRDGAFVLLAGASRRELGSWEGVDGEMTLNVKSKSKARKALKVLAKELGVAEGDILDFELQLVDAQPATVRGLATTPTATASITAATTTRG